MTTVELAGRVDAQGYVLDEAAPLIGMGVVQLRVYLWRHPELADTRYKAVGRMRVRKRVLLPDEVKRIIAARSK